MNATTNVTILDLDAMMDIKMDEVETLPDFITPPAGNYVLQVKEAKVEKYNTKAEPNVGKQRIRVLYSVVKTEEVAAGSIPVADGSLFSETFMATEDGIKYFKKAALGILSVTDFEDATIKDVMDGLKDVEFKARITTRSTKDAATGNVYENITVRPVPSV